MAEDLIFEPTPQGLIHYSLITTVLRKYVTGLLYEKEEVHKLLDILADRKA